MVDKNDVILIITAHPDDEVLGCGATIKKYFDLGGRADFLSYTFRRFDLSPKRGVNIQPK
jgi:hypothetical protein